MEDHIITLGQFLKYKDIIQSGGEAKEFLANRVIYVNGELENRRGKKLRKGDKVTIDSNTFVVE